MNPLDYSAEDSFNPQNIEHWLLLASFIGFSIYGFWSIDKEEKRVNRPTHRYNRKTGKVELDED
jgi:hypothetical protein